MTHGSFSRLLISSSVGRSSSSAASACLLLIYWHVNADAENRALTDESHFYVIKFAASFSSVKFIINPLLSVCRFRPFSALCSAAGQSFFTLVRPKYEFY